MASRAANAVRYDLAQRKMSGAMRRISEATGVPVPNPIGKTDSLDHRHALEAERMAGFLASVADRIHQPTETTP